MKWKTAFKIALLHPLQTVWAFFDSDHHKIVSREGQRRLQKLALIKMMKQDQELGLYIINDVTSMATLETQYKMYLEKNPDSKWTYDEWLKWHSEWLAESIKNIDPTVSDDFQIGPDGAYEHADQSPYCPVCSGCGEDGCCKATNCKMDPNGHYCGFYLNELKIGYLMDEWFTENLYSALTEEQKTQYDEAYEQVIDKVYGKDNSRI